MKWLPSRAWPAALLVATLVAQAQDLPTPAFLPSTAQAQAWIEADPAVVKARHAAAAATHGGAAIAASSHEWTVRVQGQQRRYQDSGATSREWLAQLERGIRINGKAGLDRELSELEARLGQFRVGEARHESARALSDLWTGVIAAERQRTLLQEQLAFARSNLDAVERRRRAGDASVLDVNIAQADIGEVQREASLAATEAAKLRAALRVRYAAEAPPGATLPEPREPIWPEPKWRDRVIDEADPLKTAEGEGQRARLQAVRARADRVPDPTVGVFTANEALRNERVVGVSFSMPIGGTYRSARALQAEKEADAAQAAFDDVRRSIELEAAQTYAEAAGSLERWRIARDTARLAGENARLSQRSYALGEGDLQALLLARRQASMAARAALDAQWEAVRWEMRLLIDAHLIWDLAKD